MRKCNKRGGVYEVNTFGTILSQVQTNWVSMAANITTGIHSPSTSKSNDFPVFSSLQKYKMYQYPYPIERTKTIK